MTMDSTASSRTKRCPQCGASFQCTEGVGPENCWCEALPNVMPIGELRQCLCPSCLLAVISKRSVKKA